MSESRNNERRVIEMLDSPNGYPFGATSDQALDALTRAEQRIAELERDRQSSAVAVTITGLQKCIAKQDAEIEELRRGYEQIEAWSKAYPVAIFPEPDWKRATKALRDAGMTIDLISASNMRHVITRVQEIAIAYTGREPASGSGEKE